MSGPERIRRIAIMTLVVLLCTLVLAAPAMAQDGDGVQKISLPFWARARPSDEAAEDRRAKRASRGTALRRISICIDSVSESRPPFE